MEQRHDDDDNQHYWSSLLLLWTSPLSISSSMSPSSLRGGTAARTRRRFLETVTSSWSDSDMDSSATADNGKGVFLGPPVSINNNSNDDKNSDGILGTNTTSVTTPPPPPTASSNDNGSNSSTTFSMVATPLMIFVMMLTCFLLVGLYTHRHGKAMMSHAAITTSRRTQASDGDTIATNSTCDDNDIMDNEMDDAGNGHDVESPVEHSEDAITRIPIGSSSSSSSSSNNNNNNYTIGDAAL